MFTKSQILLYKDCELRQRKLIHYKGLGMKFDVDGIEKTPNGSALAEFIESLGFDVLGYGNLGTHGTVSFCDDDGYFYKMSTAGYCQML